MAASSKQARAARASRTSTQRRHNENLQAHFFFCTFTVLSTSAHAVTFVSKCQSLGSGSYQLVADINAAGDCFVVTAPDVTINFAGQTVKGTGAGTAVKISGNDVARVNVRGGTITGFARGIDLQNETQVQIQATRIYGISDFGIRVSNTAIVGDNIVHTTGIGIISGCRNNFLQNVAEDNPLGNLADGNCTNNKVDNLGF